MIIGHWNKALVSLMLRHGRYEHAVARTVGILLSAFGILKATKKNPFTFSWRTTILFLRRPYRLTVSERIDVHAHCQELLAARTIELTKGEYVCATVISSKKYIFGNWTEKRMCGDYRPVIRKTRLDQYPMPIVEELFDALRFSRIFSTLDLRSSYHQLPLLVGNQVKIAL